MNRNTACAALIASVLGISALSGCGGSGDTAAGGTVTVTEIRTVTAPAAGGSTQAPTGSGAGGTYPSGDPVVRGYPLVVSASAVDSRVRSGTRAKKLVALAPGVYAPYNPAVESDLTAYLDSSVLGDCVAIKKWFASSSSSCWPGVFASAAEPQ